MFQSTTIVDTTQGRSTATAFDGITNDTVLPKIKARRDENNSIVDEDVLLISIIIGIAIFLTLSIVLVVLVSLTRTTLENKRKRTRADSSPGTPKQSPNDPTAIVPRTTKIHTFNLTNDSADDEFPRQLTITINDGRLSTISELDTIRVVHTCTGRKLSDSHSNASSPARRSVGSSHTHWSDKNATPQSHRSRRRDLDTLATNATPRGYSTDMSYGNQSYDSCSNIDAYQDNVYSVINGQTIEYD